MKALKWSQHFSHCKTGLEILDVVLILTANNKDADKSAQMSTYHLSSNVQKHVFFRWVSIKSKSMHKNQIWLDLWLMKIYHLTIKKPAKTAFDNYTKSSVAYICLDYRLIY